MGAMQLMGAACQLCREAAIGFTTAGQMWGFRGMGDAAVHVLIPHRTSLQLSGVVIHRCRNLDHTDLAGRRPDGIRLTSPPRTLIDAAGLIGPDRTASAIEQALSERRFTLATLMRVMHRLDHPRRPGAKVVREVLLARPPWRGAARSDLEITVRRAIAERCLPEPVVNMPYALSSGHQIEIDLAWPDWKVACEVDHPFWHDGVLESHRDKRRDRRLAGEGWATPRVTERDIEQDLDSAVDDLMAILRERGWRPNSVPALG